MTTEKGNCELTDHADKSEDSTAKKINAQILLLEIGKLFVESDPNIQQKLLSLKTELANLNKDCKQKTDRVVQLETSEFRLKSQLKFALGANFQLQEENDTKDEIIRNVIADKNKLKEKLKEVETQAVATKVVLKNRTSECEKELQDALAENINLQDNLKRLGEDARKYKSENADLVQLNSELAANLKNVEIQNALLKDKTENLQAQLKVDRDFQKGLAEEQINRINKQPILAKLLSRYGYNSTEATANKSSRICLGYSEYTGKSWADIARIGAKPNLTRAKQLVPFPYPPQAIGGNGLEETTATYETKKRKDAPQDESPVNADPATVPHCTFISSWNNSNGGRMSVITKRYRRAKETEAWPELSPLIMETPIEQNIILPKYHVPIS